MAKKHFRLAITQKVTECEKNNREQPGITIGSSFDSRYTADGPTRTTNKNSICILYNRVGAQNGHTHGYSADNYRCVVVDSVTAAGFTKTAIPPIFL